MAAKDLELPLIVIVGPTASGKTSLALELAEQFKGEVICADSRTIYKGMDIGTAKPTKEEQARVPHWGLDLAKPGERFTAADFKRYAQQKIEEIRLRGHVPLLVGGTGLYIDAVIFDYQFGTRADETLRTKLEKLTLEQLHEYCEKNNVSMPENTHNKRYVIRAIERNGSVVKRNTAPIESIIIVGIATEPEILRKKIAQRSEHLFENGVVNEATKLGKIYGWNSEAMTGNIYPLVHLYLKSVISYEEMKEKITTRDWQLAKRQNTWLRRNPHITWLPLTEAKGYIEQQLANEHKS
jgi:tRNA dimethylallyltransferase